MGNSAKADPDVADAVAGLACPGPYVLAYSGGIDSSVLLHALAARRAQGLELRALHVNHGLQPQAADWARHCQSQAAALGVPCAVLTLDAAPTANLEAWAREQRYAALQAALQPGEQLLTAHHRRDQAETVLLHLLRGSGETGLAAMAPQRRLGPHRLLRPLLAVAPERIAAYAKAQGLSWLEDPANAELRFDRNFLRREILPRLSTRFAGAERNLARSAGLLGELSGLIDPQAYAVGGGLSLERLALAPDALRGRVLFAWLRRRGLPTPRHRMLGQIWQQFLQAAPDAEPRVAWPGAELRRYRGVLYAMAPLTPVTPLRWPLDAAGEAAWPHGGRLRWRLDGPAEVRLPQGGEQIVLGDRQRRLKSLFQQAGVPPWERRRTPLLWRQEQLLAVGNRWRSAATASLLWQWEIPDWL